MKNAKMKDLPKIDMPREKLEKYGSQKLKDHELLAIILGSGIKGKNVLELSKEIVSILYKERNRINFKDLIKISGLGKARASQILSLITLVDRLTIEKPEMLSALDIWNLCSDIKNSKREHFVVFYLDTQHRLIERQIISIGTLDSSLVHPREVFEPALSLHAASILIAHNHPSENLDPSDEDIEVTQRLVEAGKLLGIALLDHVIITTSEYMSFAQKNLL